MTELADRADDLDHRVTALARFVRTIEAEMREQQLEAIMPGGNSNTGGSGPADPTPAMVARLSSFHQQTVSMTKAVNEVHAKLDEAEAAFDRVLRELMRDHVRQPEKLTCPGWPVQDFADRIGGCGSIAETYRRADGTTAYRRHGLCMACRKRKQRTEGEWMGEVS